MRQGILFGLTIASCFLSLFLHEDTGNCMTTTEIRVRRNISLPVDPLKIKTMGEYDFTLLYSRTWLEYDSARRAIPGIVESWLFDPKIGTYHFKISKNSRWSDGSQIKSSDLRVNLERAFKLGSSYGKSLSALFSISQFHIVDDLNFSIKMTDRQPADSFFEKMGSIFLAIVNPKDLNPDLTLKSNTLSAGPFTVTDVSADEVILRKNEYFQNGNASGPSKISFRNTDKNFSVKDFSQGKTWENYAQLYSYLPKDEADALLSSKLPLWTRSYDRISLLRIGNGAEKSKSREKTLNQITAKLHSLGQINLPLNIKRASSLQPNGFPLFQALRAPVTHDDSFHAQQIKIIAPEGLSTKFHMEFLKPVFDSLNLSVSWVQRPLNEFLDLLKTDTSYDLALVSFGVADPEPSTWMSLVMDTGFIQASSEDKSKFQKILALTDRKKEVDLLKNLLQEMHLRGSYTPLFWGSTLSIGQDPISFEKIRELDETVDLSKIVFKK